MFLSSVGSLHIESIISVMMWQRFNDLFAAKIVFDKCLLNCIPSCFCNMNEDPFLAIVMKDQVRYDAFSIVLSLKPCGPLKYY